MVAKLVGKLSSHRRTRIALHVRESSLSAQLFFRVQGFRAAEVVREYFEDTAEDAYVMQYLFDEVVTAERHAVPVNRIARQFEN
jgi:ribosomal-protein-alanine N-acetyltransferase